MISGDSSSETKENKGRHKRKKTNTHFRKIKHRKRTVPGNPFANSRNRVPKAVAETQHIHNQFHNTVKKSLLVLLPVTAEDSFILTPLVKTLCC